LIEPLRPEHWPEVAAIYQAGIDTGQATFETEVPTWETWNQDHLLDHRYVDVEKGRVRGWIALSTVSDRCVYGGVAEVSVYVAPDYRGNGIGRRLLEAAIGSTEAGSIWTLQAGMFPENQASRSLHESTGFRLVGVRERIGRHHGVWRDTVLMERRSPMID